MLAMDISKTTFLVSLLSRNTRAASSHRKNIVPYLVLGLLFGLLVQSLTLWLPG
jgi:hypothetical protein